MHEHQPRGRPRQERLGARARPARGGPAPELTDAFEIGSWQVTLRWPASGRGGPTEITIAPRPGADPFQTAQGITSTVLRSIPLNKLTKKMRAALDAEHDGGLVPGTGEPADVVADRIRAATERDPTPGRKGRPDEFFALVAALYIWNIDNRHSNPVQRIAESCGSTWRAAANWVRLARRRGLLAEGRERSPGGELTPEALRILAGGAGS
ncbi:hypothetical protein [Actinomadura violacea]|uniref:Uncharacterized protein n=1 Tax=Actinomadura violacea TaxID=2819934 RepID=A0ABS3RMK4_9ACTN|nr:hypothetical protein [Actinomadura violacea]MBO2457966.1 hypothetical protein [Actinomadura violacea]